MEVQYYGQFVISRRDWTTPTAFSTRQYGPWVVKSHESLPVTSIRTQDGHAIGCIIGCAIDVANGLIVDGDLTLPLNSGHAIEKKETAIHKLMNRLGGRFICLIVDKDFQRLYLDAIGHLSCVYANSQEVAASTPGLILDRDEYDSTMDHELARLLDISSRVSARGFYPAGLTPHPAINRLLPNHYLDLNSWKAIRHWPAAKIATVTFVEQNVASIAETLKATIHAILQSREIYLPITAGRDSRMLLACSRAHLDRIKLIQFVNPKGNIDPENIDHDIAKRLARAHNLDIEFLPIVVATAEERNRWYYEVGHCIGGRISDIYPTMARLDGSRVIIPGLGAGAGKHRYWRRSDKADTEITQDRLLQRMGLPSHPQLRRAVGAWLEEASYFLNTFQLLDLAQIEHRDGAWGSPSTYGQVRFVDHVYPICQRTIFENMLSLPSEYKFKNRLNADVIQREWPDLLDLPFNRYVGPRNWLVNAKKVRKLPARLVKGLADYLT